MEIPFVDRFDVELLVENQIGDNGVVYIISQCECYSKMKSQYCDWIKQSHSNYSI